MPGCQLWLLSPASLPLGMGSLPKEGAMPRKAPNRQQAAPKSKTKSVSKKPRLDMKSIISRALRALRSSKVDPGMDRLLAALRPGKKRKVRKAG